jgi:hypothetical protein
MNMNLYYRKKRSDTLSKASPLGKILSENDEQRPKFLTKGLNNFTEIIIILIFCKILITYKLFILYHLTRRSTYFAFLF